MIYGCIITYNDMPLIQQTIESIVDKVDRIIVIDGRYTDFPGHADISTDGTIEYLKSIDKVFLMYYKGREVDKRNCYLMQLAEGDTVINLDADEVLIGELPPLTSEFGILDLHDGHSKHVQKRATRLFKYHKNIEYRFVHYTLYRGNILLNKLSSIVDVNTTFENVTSCHILHNWHMRDHARQYQKSIYYKALVRSESGFEK